METELRNCRSAPPVHIPFCLIHVSGFGIPYFSLKNCYGALDTVQIDTEALADVTILPAVVSCFEGLTRIGGATGAPEPGLRGGFHSSPVVYFQDVFDFDHQSNKDPTYKETQWRHCSFSTTVRVTQRPRSTYLVLWAFEMGFRILPHFSKRDV